MKKIAIYLGLVIVLFGGLYGLNVLSQDNSTDNVYGIAVSKLHPETAKLLDDPNYQNIVLPDELDAKIKSNEGTFVYFFSSTCSYCKATTPKLMPIAKEAGVTPLQFNLLEFEEGWKKYNIEATPTLVYYKDGKEVERMVGGYAESANEGNTADMFKAFFNKHKA
ncbi:thioredoxin family protein [Paenibacillus thermoaerophilus]|jgi:thioredoxin 1|uniref:Thioredoxin family protein n=1 Tax=Paenibacillus thermoaerophilus TaxID=1215385 RepID=A0ABW2V5G3_9BACL|nr:thioredoxin family protein [Paenibacillus thermoaerophilus]TMV17825.1 thioredoxin family protein [Paenibacillus thermoaerophilus]